MRERQRRYEQTEKGRATKTRYNHSLKGMAMRLRAAAVVRGRRTEELRGRLDG